MSRTMVNRADGDQVPFLRGILTQSLVKSGLSFDEAYSLAQAVRTELKDETDISSADLKDRVAELLQAEYGEERSRAYRTEPVVESDIMVHSPTRNEPFSIGVLTHSLVACAIDPAIASQAAHCVHTTLRESNTTQIDERKLDKVIYECLRGCCSAKLAERFVSWQRFKDSGDPLVILLGGVTGSGKSTISTELGYRLDIGRTQSTDMIREIIRSYITLNVAPTLQYSSFEAWRGMPSPNTPGRRQIDTSVVTGFLSQLSIVKPAVDAAVKRALQEREHLILEGVHVAPKELDLTPDGNEGIVVPVMIAIPQKKILRTRLKRRGRENAERSAKRYIDQVDNIWMLQSFLLNAADEHGIPIIPNLDFEHTIMELLELLSRKITERFPADVESMDWET